MLAYGRLPSTIVKEWKALGENYGSHTWSLACFAALHQRITSHWPKTVAMEWRQYYSHPKRVQARFESAWRDGFGSGEAFPQGMVGKVDKEAWVGPADMCEALAHAGICAGTVDVMAAGPMGVHWVAAAKDTALAAIILFTRYPQSSAPGAMMLPVMVQPGDAKALIYIVDRCVRGGEYWLLVNSLQGGSLGSSYWMPARNLLDHRSGPYQVCLVKSSEQWCPRAALGTHAPLGTHRPPGRSLAAFGLAVKCSGLSIAQ